MPIDVIMPKLEMAQDTGTVVRWLKAEGSTVQKGEPLLEIETDKVAVQVEAPGSGILSRVIAAEGEEVPVGQVIALISSPAEAAAAAPSAPAATPVAQRMAAAHNVDLQQVQTAGRRIEKQDIEAYLARGASQPQAAAPGLARLTPASPLARRLAWERGVAVTQLRGSGLDGAVLAADVRQQGPALPVQSPAFSPVVPEDRKQPIPQDYAPPGRTGTERGRGEGQVPSEGQPDSGYRVIPLKGTRKIIAERVQRSFQSAPHIALTLPVDMTEVRRLMERLSAAAPGHLPAGNGAGSKLGLTAILARCCAVALTHHPRLNAHVVEGSNASLEIREFASVHLGMAVALDDGLIVPVIRDAQAKGLSAIQAEIDDLVRRARAGALKLEEVKGSTFTISNLGMFGIEQFSAILNPPEVGLLAIGAIIPGPLEIQGQMVMRPLMRLTLMADHRAVDGAVGARFLATLKAMLENPYLLLT
ncbi:MAG: 2-oxo acid dehydrogenase subunit E2 [Chloroflexi bacterium]|nr:2-oxo acid dehydrogenase subunit E2 [Chloroflexota bacterium]